MVTILIGAQISSDVLYNPGLGNALALGMVVIMTISIGCIHALQRLAERWLQLTSAAGVRRCNAFLKLNR